MKIGIDISQIIYGTGVSNYTTNLVRALLKLDKNNQYILFGGYLRRKKDFTPFLESLDGNFTSRLFPIPPTVADIIWNRLSILKIEKIVGNIDLLHSSDWTQPPTDAHKVTTIHDVVPLKYPKLSHSRIVSVQTRRFQKVCNQVDKIIVPSNTTMEDVIDMGVGRSKVTVISEAPDPQFKKADGRAVNDFIRKYRINGDYILSIGVTPRKNTERIIEAFEKVRPEIKVQLVFIGETKIITKHTRGILYLGHIPRAELPVAITGAKVMVYPSLYEGFGLPILEAFSCETPVVTSNIGSMYEVASDAAELVDPYSVEDIARGIVDATTCSKILIKKGKNRLKSFSWEKAAKATLNLYESFSS